MNIDYNTKEEVRYIDKSFREKRRILQELYNQNAQAYKYIKLIAYKLSKNVKFSIGDIENFLIGGFLAYHKKIEGNSKIDPSNLVVEIVNGKCFWRYIPTQELIPDRDIVYISYNESSSDMTFSLLDQLYRKIVAVDDKEFEDYVIEKYTDILNYNYDMLSLKGVRKQKIKRIL